jgi:DNA-binding winged helix-turn-helix (wHTH) protein/TolB-like protein
MSVQVSRIFEFGPFRLNEAECQLFREGKQVPIPPKVFATLMLLIENRGHLVGKDELMSRLWPDSFVEEVSLNRSISTLRKALGDTTTAPLYVETVPKRGYRFIAPVIETTGCDELIVERWSSAEIVTEEVEETLSPYSQPRLGISSAIEKAHITVPAPAISTAPKPGTDIRRRFLFAALALAAFAAASSYFWSSNRDGRVPATAPLKSIAVLPFKVMGAESGHEHIGLGVADVLITRLSNIRELNVRPTSAVMNFVGTDSAAAGRQLKVDAVLEGTIYRAGDRVRVTARLLKVSDQSPLWAGQFEKPLQDELKVQDEISLQLVDALALSLSGAEKIALTKRYTESADAYQLYLKGRYHWNKRYYEGFVEAERLFRNAIEKDPNFALAYVGLVDKLAMTDPHLSMTVVTDEKIRSLKKALELDPNLAEGTPLWASSGCFITGTGGGPKRRSNDQSS